MKNQSNKLIKGSVSRRVALNAIISSSAKVTWSILSLVALSVITRHLGTEGLGAYSTVLAYFSLFSAIAELGLNQTLLREISKKDSRAEESRLVSTAFTAKLLISLIVFALAAILVRFLNHPEQVKNGILIVSLGLFFAGAYQLLNGLFQKRLMAFKVSLAELAGRFANLVWVLICYYLDYGLAWIVVGLLFSWLTTYIAVFLMASKKVRIRLNFDFNKIKPMLKDSLPLGISAILTFLYLKIDTIILSSFKGLEDVGIYNLGYKLFENISYFPGMFMGLIMPMFSRYLHKKPKKFRSIADKAFAALSFIAVGASLGIFSLAEKIIPILRGQQSLESVWVLKIITLALFGVFMGQFFNSILISAKKQKKLLLIFLICAIFNVVANLIFIPQYSFYAAAVISAITELLVPLLSMALIIKELKYLPKIKQFVKILLAGAIMLAVIMFIKKSEIAQINNLIQFNELIGRILEIIILVLIGGGIYLGTAYSLKAITKKDFLRLLGR
ncbi:MAG: oligosaccharide flippase family protein [Candidatus Moranbacteria bacterium]|nr:oligosaccharide flippase family protein [Candidatus Moranbacteria bacterium]